MSATAAITARDLDRIGRVVAVHAGDATTPALHTVILSTSGPWVVATATDRYAIATLRVSAVTDDDGPAASPGFEAWIPLPAFRQAVAMFKPSRTHNPVLTLTIDGDSLTIAADGLISTFAAATLRVRLQDHDAISLKGLLGLARKAHEAEPAATTAFLNPNMLRKFAAAQQYGEPMVAWSSSETKAWAVAVGEDFRGVLMPVRGGADRSLDAGWSTILGVTSEAAEVAA